MRRRTCWRIGHRRLAFVDHSPDQEASLDKLAGCQRAVAAVAGAELLILDHVAVKVAAP